MKAIHESQKQNCPIFQNLTGDQPKSKIVHQSLDHHRLLVKRGFRDIGIDIRVGRIMQKYIPLRNQSRSRDKQKIGKISNFNSNEISPFNETQSGNYSEQQSSILSDCSQRNLHLQNDLNKISVLMEKNQHRSKKTKGKIMALEEINGKINQLIISLKEEELLQKYDSTLALDHTSDNHDLKDVSKISKKSTVYDSIFSHQNQSVCRGSKRGQQSSYRNLRGCRSSLPSRVSNINYHKLIRTRDNSCNPPKKLLSKNRASQKCLTAGYTYSPKLQHNIAQLPNDFRLVNHPSNQEKLMKRLYRQIKYDEQFSKHKVILYKQRVLENPKVFSAISKKVHELLPNISFHSIEAALKLEFEEKDPLFTERLLNSEIMQDAQGLIQKFIEVFVKAEKHWSEKIQKKFTRQTINLKQLSTSKDKKFTKEELVRFICLSTKRMLTNRAIYHIYRRLQLHRKADRPTDDSILIQTFLLCLCK